MDELLKIFLTWQFMIFCLGIAAITFVFRKVLEYAILNRPTLPGNPNSKIWRDLVLPVAPVLLGALAGWLATGYPYPDGLSGSTFGRVSFGLVSGLFSGLMYRVVMGLLRGKIPDASLAPVAPVLSATADAEETVLLNDVKNSINKDQ